MHDGPGGNNSRILGIKKRATHVPQTAWKPSATLRNARCKPAVVGDVKMNALQVQSTRWKSAQLQAARTQPTQMQPTQMQAAQMIADATSACDSMAFAVEVVHRA